MTKIKKHIFAITMIGISSQIYLMLFTQDFMISAGIISFFIIYYFYRDLNPIVSGIFSGILVSLLRVGVSMIYGGSFSQGFIAYFSEIFFYITIGISITIFIKKDFFNKSSNFFLIPFITDIMANIVEMSIRNKIGIINLDYKIIGTLILVGFTRAFIIWAILNTFKYYKVLVVNRENAEKYKEFLMISSGLKNEIFLMEKNMVYIENLMTEAYNLYDNISNNEKQSSWQDRSINIAKDIHEIKKDYSLVLHGLRNITEISLDQDNMSLHKTIKIIEDGVRKLIKGRNIDGIIQVQLGEDFSTSSHFELISIFRNLLINSVDAIENKKNGKIQFIHDYDEKNHIFKIIDNGIGIDPKNLEYIFSPGFSTKIDYDTGNINRGLGLSIAQDIVQNKLYGSMEISSNLKKGTSFKIVIPRKSLEVENN